MLKNENGYGVPVLSVSLYCRTTFDIVVNHTQKPESGVLHWMFL